MTSASYDGSLDAGSLVEDSVQERLRNFTGVPLIDISERERIPMRVSKAVAVAMILAGGPAMTATADSFATRCVSEDLYVRTTPITSQPTTQAIRMLPFCRGASVTVQRVDGTLRQQVKLTEINEIPDYLGTWGWFSAPVRNGAGTWLITHIADSSGTYKLSKPYTFVVPRASVIPLRAVGWSSAGRTYTVRAQLLRYTSTGSLVPMAGVTVDVRGGPRFTAAYQRLATRKTDSNGWFAYSRQYSQEYELAFSTPQVSLVIAPAFRWHTIMFRPAIVVTSYHARVAIDVPTTIKGYAGPGTRVVGLRKYDELTRQWVDTRARATTGTAGRFSLRYTPKSPSSELVLSTPPDATVTWDSYVSPSIYVEVVKPTVRLTGKATATHDAVIRPGSKMSTYGHLDLADPNASTTPYVNRQVVVQVRPRSTPTAPYQTIATGTTTPTGYYYTNWTATVDVDVRVAHISNRPEVPSAFTYVRFVDVR